MTAITLAALASPHGAPPPALMLDLRQALQDVFVAPVSAPVPGPAVPASAFDSARGQYSSPIILKSLLDSAPNQKMLAITCVDLFIPMLSFVYGQAQLGGNVAVVSIARLRQEFYGLPPNPALLAARSKKEAVHETGHLFGLVHCEQPDCAMRLSTNVRQLDLKGDALCPGCAALARENV